jgi:hypothetical protein
MMTRAVPWDDIRKPDATDYNVRLVAGSGPIPLFWGRDNDGRCLFIIELEGDNTALFVQSDVALNGISVDLRLLDASRSQGLVLTLEQHADRDLFLGLCQTLIDSLQQAQDCSEALSLALAHLKRWKAFLASPRARILSPQEISGLFAELQFLRSLVHRVAAKAAVDAWCGPNGSHQDFIFGNTAVETKAISGRERSAVRISSEDQLESTCDNLFLAVFRLSKIADSDHAVSLNDMVRLIESELTDAAALEDFWARLGAYGYAAMRDYDAPKFIVAGQRVFAVVNGFPRLIRSGLPAGVTRVCYDIQLESIAAFERPTDQIWRE